MMRAARSCSGCAWALRTMRAVDLTTAARQVWTTAAPPKPKKMTKRVFCSWPTLGMAPRRGLSTAVAGGAAKAAEQPPDRAVGYWLVGCGFLVAGMVSVGGLTRLTRSGLSMTDWRLQGSLPPLSDAEWAAEFARYKQFPEWQQRQSMTVEEFKFIYWWEYGHRMLGRVVGVAFVGPLIYFGVAQRGRLPAELKPRLAALLGLGAAQGLVGWWMVRSGLEMDPEQRKEIRVSPYRLATHLAMAFTTYSLLVWTALDVLRPDAARRARELPALALRHGARLRPLAAAATCLVFTTAMSGAFVAGNDAGRAYNTWPKMGDDWVPDGLLSLRPLYRNFFENTATVQLDHRLLAYASAAAVGALAALARLAVRGEAWRTLPNATRLAIAGGTATAVAQVTLGIATLLCYVPTPLAAAHQLGSLVLLTAMLAAAHSLKFANPGLRLLRASANKMATMKKETGPPPQAAVTRLAAT